MDTNLKQLNNIINGIEDVNKEIIGRLIKE